jgi:hypothetical protein
MASLELLKPEHRDKWMEVLAQSFQHDVYHLPAYHGLAEERGEGEAHLFVYREDLYTIGVPLLLRSIDELPYLAQAGEEWWDATSVYGYAGPVASHLDVPASVVRNFQAALCEALTERRVVSVFSRLHPLIVPQAGLLSGLGECVPLGQTVSIDLKQPVDQQYQQYRNNHKRDIRRARQEGVACVHDEDWEYLDAFIEIYHARMKHIGAADYYFFEREYFGRLHDMLGNHLHLFVALKEGVVLSGALFTLCDSIVQYHLGGTCSCHLDLSPLKLIFDTVRIWGTELGVGSLHLGGGLGSREDGVFHFKGGFSKMRCQFKVWRVVVDQGVYQQLLEHKRVWCKDKGLEITDNHYFPAYRCPAKG